MICGRFAGSLASIVTGLVTVTVFVSVIVCGHSRITPPLPTFVIACSIVGYVADTPLIGVLHTPTIAMPGSTAPNGLKELVNPPRPPCTAYAGVGLNSASMRELADVTAASARAANPRDSLRRSADDRFTPPQLMNDASARWSSSTVAGFAGLGWASWSRSATDWVGGPNGSPTSN